MAMNASTSEASSRPQADPLPVKRGEIGYREEIHGQGNLHVDRPIEVLPARHPADRDAPPSAIEVSSSVAESVASHTPPTTHSSSSSTRSGKRSLLLLFKQGSLAHVGGMRPTTLSFLILQLVGLGGTIALWVISIRLYLSRPSNQNAQSSISKSSLVIAIHVIFAIASIFQLLFLERRVFRLRAERYAYKHPDELDRTTSRSGAGLAPWNRPPLPTYAATLTAGGYGTGDVEDNVIAVPPPPAYGITRGSTLLLSGFLRESLRAQRPVSVHSQASRRTSVPEERPRSYASADEEWQVVREAEQAVRPEETLARLERVHLSRQPTAATTRT
jgi:hypothetical protein